MTVATSLPNRIQRVLLLCVLLTAVGPLASFAQICGHWTSDGGFPGPWQHSDIPQLKSAVVWDSDAEGPALPEILVTGAFQHVGDDSVLNPRGLSMARWDGMRWSEERRVPAVSGQKVGYRHLLINVAGGELSAWRSSRWTSIASFTRGQGTVAIRSVRTIGSLLYVAGTFDHVNGTPVSSLVTWNGSDWLDATVPAGMEVHAVAADGEAEYIVGVISPDPRLRILRRAHAAGSAWLFLGDGINLPTNTTSVAATHLVIHDGRPFVGIGLQIANVASILLTRWEDNQWAQDPIRRGGLHDLLSFDGELVLLGSFKVTSNNPFTQDLGTMRRNPSGDWEPLGNAVIGDVTAHAVLNGRLHVFGRFRGADTGAFLHTAFWDGVSWRPMGDGIAHEVYAMTVFNGELIAGGPNYVSRLTPDGWRPLGTRFDAGYVSSLTVIDGVLHAAGKICNLPAASTLCVPQLYRWSGLEWHVHPGVQPGFHPITVVTQFRGDLIIAGVPYARFPTQILVNGLARWDGQAWQALGQGVQLINPPGPSSPSLAVGAVTDFGGDLIVGGNFNMAGGRPAANVARWDGVDWHPMSNGLPASPGNFVEWNGRLYTSVSRNGIYSWDGARWSPLEQDPTREVSAGWLLIYANQLVFFHQEFGVWIFDGALWRRLDIEFGSTSISSVFEFDGHLLISGGPPMSYNNAANRGYLARWSFGGDAPRNFTIIAPSNTSVRRGAGLTQGVFYSSDLSQNFALTLNGRALSGPPDSPCAPRLGPIVDQLGTRRLIISSAQPEFAGDYALQVSNDCGTIQVPLFSLVVRCGGDFDADGTVSVADLYAYLAAYFRFSTAALHGPCDNGSNTLTVRDLLAFLTDYLTPCP